MKPFKAILRYVNLLSIDVVLGACAGMFFFADLTNVKLGWQVYILLAMAVWSLYTFDHLWDARQVKNHAHTLRHRFHQKYFKSLAIILILVSSAALLFCYLHVDRGAYLVPGIILALLILGSMVLLKFLGKYLVLLKEVSIALFYVLGILLAPLWKMDFEFSSSEWVYYGLGFFLLASFNLVFLSFIDAATDLKDGHASVVSQLGAQKTKSLLWGMLATGMIYCLFLFYWMPSYYHVYTLIWGTMLIFHFICFLEQPGDPEELRRKLEWVFILPFILVLI